MFTNLPIPMLTYDKMGEVHHCIVIGHELYDHFVHDINKSLLSIIIKTYKSVSVDNKI